MRTLATLSALLLLAAATPAAAYEVKVDSSGAPVRWADGALRLTVHDVPRKAGLEPEAAAAATMAAVATWNASLGGKVELSVETRSGKGQAGHTVGGENSNSIVFEAEEWLYDEALLAVTIVTVDVKRHAIVDADIVVNAVSKRWAFLDGEAAKGRRHDLQNTLTHELGHLMGLEHNPVSLEAVMFPGSTPGETHKRVLADDDRDGVRFLYLGGLASPVAVATTPSGCSSSGASAVSLSGLLLAAVALARPRRLRVAAVVTTVALAVLPQVASAGEEDPLAPTPDQAEASAEQGASDGAVVEGTVVSSTTYRSRGALFTTASILQVRRCLEGRCQVEQVRVLQPGGRIGDLEQVVEGSTPLRAGDEVVLVLRKLATQEAYRIEGLDRGVVRLRGKLERAVALQPRGALRLTTASRSSN